MKKVGYILITILEIALLAGAYIVNYFTKKKMGMARYVLYKNREWEQDYSIVLLKNISMAVLIILIIVVMVLAIKQGKKLGGMQRAMCIFMVVLAVISFLFTIGNTTRNLRAYYFISPMLAGALLLQILKTGIWILIGGKKNEA